MAAPVSPTAGQNVDKTFWDTEVYDRWVDLYGSWTAFTTTWSGATTNPVLGNGTLDCAYKQLGKTCHFRLRLVIGSTTTLGSGLWAFTLPASAVPTQVQSLSGFINNSAGSARYAIAGYLTAGTGIFRIPINGTSGAQSTAPFAWASNDQLALTGTYETT